MKRDIGIALGLMGLALSLGGCGGVVGLAVGAASRAAGTGSAYAEWKASAPSLQPNTGRLLVYMPTRGFSLYTADWATGGEFRFAVDRDECDVIGDSFMYVDLPPGEHTIAPGTPGPLLLGFRKGAYQTAVKIDRGRSTFVRFESANGGIRPVVVGANQAEADLAKLPLDTHFASFTCKQNAAG